MARLKEIQSKLHGVRRLAQAQQSFQPIPEHLQLRPAEQTPLQLQSRADAAGAAHAQETRASSFSVKVA